MTWLFRTCIIFYPMKINKYVCTRTFFSLFSFYHIIYTSTYTVCNDPRQSAIFVSERNVHLYLLYPYSNGYLTVAIPVSMVPALFGGAFVSKVVSGAASADPRNILL